MTIVWGIMRPQTWKDARDRDRKLGEFVVGPRLEICHALTKGNLISSRNRKSLGQWRMSDCQKVTGKVQNIECRLSTRLAKRSPGNRRKKASNGAKLLIWIFRILPGEGKKWEKCDARLRRGICLQFSVFECRVPNSQKQGRRGIYRLAGDGVTA